MIIEEAGRRNVSGFFFYKKQLFSFYNQNLRFNAMPIIKLNIKLTHIQ